MEYQNTKSFECQDISAITPHEDLQHELYSIDRRPFIMKVTERLAENRQRRMLLQIQKEKEKEVILLRRKRKDENARRILEAKQTVQENSKQVHEEFRKQFNRYASAKSLAKQKWIESKIEQSRQLKVQNRNRAKWYKTNYQKFIHSKIKEKEKRVEEKRSSMEKQSQQKKNQYHLKQWKEYSKKIIKKYQNSPTSQDKLYDRYLKKEKQIARLISKFKDQNPRTLKTSEPESRKAMASISQQKLIRTKNIKYKKKVTEGNPIEMILALSQLGLQKSMKNTEDLFQKISKFLNNHRSVQQPVDDRELISKLEDHLNQYEDQIL